MEFHNLTNGLICMLKSSPCRVFLKKNYMFDFNVNVNMSIKIVQKIIFVMSHVQRIRTSNDSCTKYFRLYVSTRKLSCIMNDSK